MSLSASHCFFLLTILVIGTNCAVTNICPLNKSPLPNIDSCSSYYDCSTGSPVAKTCASGTYWNCMTQTCESKTFSFCCASTDESIFTKKDGIDYSCKQGAIAPDKDYDNFFYICINGSKLISGYCNANRDFCSAVSDCYDMSDEDCTTSVNHLVPATPYNTVAGFYVADAAWEVCPSDNSNFNDAIDCSSYYNCSSGVAKLYKCPDGYFYDCMNDVCSTNFFAYCCFDDENPAAQNVQVDYYNYRCKNNRITYDSWYSDAFYICENNRVYVGECDNKLYCNITKTCYNETIETCAPPPTTTSTTTTSITTTTSSTSITTILPTTTPSKCFNSTSAVGIYNNCKNYIYYNTTGVAEIFACRNNTLFNSFRKCCMSPNETFVTGCFGDPNKPAMDNTSCSSIGRNVEDLNDCAKYYTCSSSKTIVSQSCPSGQLFDWKLATCTSASTANTVSGCTTSRYYKCINTDNWKNKACNIITFLPKILFKNAGNYCKSVLCRVAWFI